MATGRSGSFNISTSNQFVSGYVSWNETYDIASNSSVVSAELRLSRTNTGYETYSSGEFYIAINGNEKRNSGAFSFTYNSNTLCVSHSVTIPHNADGSKSIEIYAGGELYYLSPGLTVNKQSATVTLTTIPRASTLTAPNGTIGSYIDLIVNRASSSFTHTINWAAGGRSGTFSNVGSSYRWNITDYEIARGNTSGNSVSCSFTLITYNSGTEIGRSTASCTLYIPDNATTKPSLTLTNITVTNSGNISSWGEAIKGKSKLKLSVSSASGKYGATIKSYRITTTDGKSSNTSSIEATPSTSGTYTITVTATDTRGFSATTNKTISVYDYAPPVISSASVSRCTSIGTADNNGTYMKIYADYGFTNINGKNAIASAYAEYRVSGSGSSFTNAGNIFNGTSVVLGSGQFNIGASYEVVLTVVDTVGGKDTYNLTLGTAKAELNIGLNKVGIGKYAEKDGYLEVGYKTKFEDDVEFENPDQVRNAIGAAPGGYGLGTTAPKAPNDNPSEIMATGFYSAQHANLSLGSSWGRSHILHIEGQQNYAIQFQYDFNNQVEAIRKKMAGVWQEWEFVNPPMVANTEYRTTERNQDKVVYAKTFNVGTLPSANSSKVSGSIPTGAKLVDSYGTAVNSTTSEQVSFPIISSGNVRCVIYTSPANAVGVYSYNYDNTNYTNAIITVKYTKS
jgi:hypothetical protein